MKIVLLVVGLLLVTGVILLAVLVPIIRRWRGATRAYLVELRDEMALTGEQVVRPPESANYRGGTGRHSKVKGNGTLVLTDRRLLFRKISGGTVEVPVGSIVGTSTAKAFLGSRVGGQTHLVIETDEPAQVGFFVGDIAAWEAALRRP